MFKMLQKIGKAFMLPIAILPAAGLLLGIGGALSNPTTVATYPVLNNPVLQGVFTIMSAAGTVVFANLAMLLCVGLCIGLAKRDKGTAALAGVVGFLVMNATITSLLGIFNPDGAAIDTGVVGANIKILNFHRYLDSLAVHVSYQSLLHLQVSSLVQCSSWYGHHSNSY